ncbi:rhodanese [Aerococcus urinaehominis]|uniref:Rhodanese n=1 Tax=Aerococcus urinaehominis TaxID=128944 RepID=A0A0X8FK15_9LACT|nr:rhodanese-like domain-containing protein [Aerococcus urinaehominis]AMB98743.1 rhodanese [Aerococcus urinaehominis]SDM14424.1 Rhodanese-related sulfurtransferase [Aerococcus urinaehominis]
MKQVTIEEFQSIVENQDDLHILDVRPKDLYEAGHVPGAVHLPLSQLEDSLDELDKDTHYYTICHDGVGSKKAATILDENGFDVTNVEKGVPDYQGELEK